MSSLSLAPINIPVAHTFIAPSLEELIQAVPEIGATREQVDSDVALILECFTGLTLERPLYYDLVLKHLSFLHDGRTEEISDATIDRVEALIWGE